MAARFARPATRERSASSEVTTGNALICVNRAGSRVVTGTRGMRPQLRMMHYITQAPTAHPHGCGLAQHAVLFKLSASSNAEHTGHACSSATTPPGFNGVITPRLSGGRDSHGSKMIPGRGQRPRGPAHPGSRRLLRGCGNYVHVRPRAGPAFYLRLAIAALRVNGRRRRPAKVRVFVTEGKQCARWQEGGRPANARICSSRPPLA